MFVTVLAYALYLAPGAQNSHSTGISNILSKGESELPPTLKDQVRLLASGTFGGGEGSYQLFSFLSGGVLWNAGLPET